MGLCNAAGVGERERKAEGRLLTRIGGLSDLLFTISEKEKLESRLGVVFSIDVTAFREVMASGGVDARLSLLERHVRDPTDGNGGTVRGRGTGIGLVAHCEVFLLCLKVKVEC